MALQPLPFGAAAGPDWSFAHCVERWDGAGQHLDTTRSGDRALLAVFRRPPDAEPTNPNSFDPAHAGKTEAQFPKCSGSQALFL